MSSFIFYCSATAQTGLGHLSRCLQVAVAIKAAQLESEISFCGQFGEFAQQLLAENHFSAYEDISENLLSTAYLILDDYTITQNELDTLTSQAQKLIKIDDFDDLDTSHLDLVVNFRLGFDNHPYKAINTALGTKYFPFKSALTAIRERNLAERKSTISNIFIFIGGNDVTNAGEKLVTLIDQHLINKQIFWVTTSESAKHKVCENNVLNVLPLTANIENYYAQADFFISGGGLSKYEASFCAIPNASISQNQGQAEDSKVFDQYGLSYDLGLTEKLDNQPENVANKISDYCQQNQHDHFYHQSAQHFDSNSCQKLAQKILQVAL